MLLLLITSVRGVGIIVCCIVCYLKYREGVHSSSSSDFIIASTLLLIRARPLKCRPAS
jgi:hypothetical protein